MWELVGTAGTAVQGETAQHGTNANVNNDYVGPAVLNIKYVFKLQETLCTVCMENLTC